MRAEEQNRERPHHRVLPVCAWSPADCSIAMLLAHFPARWPERRGSALVRTCIRSSSVQAAGTGFKEPAVCDPALPAPAAAHRFAVRASRLHERLQLRPGAGYVLATEEQEGLIVTMSGSASRRMSYELSAAGLPAEADEETQAVAAGVVLAVSWTRTTKTWTYSRCAALPAEAGRPPGCSTSTRRTQDASTPFGGCLLLEAT